MLSYSRLSRNKSQKVSRLKWSLMIAVSNFRLARHSNASACGAPEVRFAEQPQLVRTQALRAHCRSQIALGFGRVAQHDQAATGCAGCDVEPQVEHCRVEFEHLVEVAQERSVNRHACSGAVQPHVVAAVAAQDVTKKRWGKGDREC